MIKVLHRINSLEQLSTTSLSYGVEVDIHAYGQNLVVHHDACKQGPNFSDWLSVCGSRFVIFNIKEEGIEAKVLEMALEYGVTNFILLDLSFPALIKMLRQGEKRIAVRVSEYEMIETALKLQHQLDWVWLDCFEGFSLSKKDYLQLLEANLKICIVSPELHGGGRTEEDVFKYQAEMQAIGLSADAVCTKYPELW